MSRWHHIARRRCKGCGESISAQEKFLSSFFDPDICTSCGEYAGFHVETYSWREVFTGTWWKPWTWKWVQEKKNFKTSDKASPDYCGLLSLQRRL